MKKALLITLAAALLVTSLASCSRRNQYEDHLGSEKETQEEEETAKDGIFGSPSEDYALTVIKKSGNSTHYGGMLHNGIEAKNVSSLAFYGCPSLTDLYIETTQDKINSFKKTVYFSGNIHYVTEGDA